jgi:exosortase/archaeosortase family protein
MLGYDFVSGYNSLAIIGSYGVIIGNHCVGFGLSYGFGALIYSYPGPSTKKLWFIPLGIFIILLINSTRVIALCTEVLKTGSFLKIEPHDLFNNLIYIIIFLLWVLWIKFFNKSPQES